MVQINEVFSNSNMETVKFSDTFFNKNLVRAI